jgi:isoquinoline 1-oxidoreductase beta subunit
LPILRKNIAATFDSGDAQPSRIDAEPQVWFEITPADRVIFYSPKVEMGQGIHTALAQIAAEELEIRWEQIEVRQAGTHIGPFDPGGTSGSFSVASLYTLLRETAATMREMLRSEAAKQLQVAPADLQMAEGSAAVTADPTRRLSYGQIVQQVTTWQVPSEKPPLKPAEQFRIIGQPMPRVDFPTKLTGQAIYGYDARLPNMRYGAIARPPSIGATLAAANPGSAATQPGVQQVVIDGKFVGIVAETRLQAYAALGQLDLRWEPGLPIQQADLEARITVGQGVGVTIQEDGDPTRQLGSPDLISAEYRTPMAAHAHLEAQAALAEVTTDRARVWVATQFPNLVQSAVAEAIGIKPEQVEVTPTFLGGGFGRKTGTDVAVEAARLSKASGAPVHVGWSRTEDMRHGYFRPPTHHTLRARLENGRIAALEHQQASGHVAFDFLPAAMMQVLGADFGAWRGARIMYGIPNRKTVAWRDSLPVPTGWWRGLGLLANTFALESFIDELAHAVGRDPLAFRLDHLPDDERGPRLRSVLEQVAERSGWSTPAPTGSARGVACCSDAGTIVTHVAEVQVIDGRIRVGRITSVVDPGLPINPDGVIAQTQGSIVMGLSSTLIEQITVRDSQVSASNFDGYPLITLADTPEIDVFVLRSGDTPYGMGEPPIGPVAAAVANAVFRLTGQRLRQLPLRIPPAS